jgi:hypothetical protein
VKPLLSAHYLRALASIGVVAFHTGRATILGAGRRGCLKPIRPAEFPWHRVVRVLGFAT